MITIVPATDAMVRMRLKDRPQASIRAVAAVDGDQVLGVGGVLAAPACPAVCLLPDAPEALVQRLPFLSGR